MTQVVFPQNSFDPSSKAWGRKVEEEVRDLRTSLDVVSSFGRNSAAGLNGTLRKISEQIAALEAAQARIDAVVADLSEQQTELAAQVAYTTSLISRDVSLENFSSGPIPGDGNNHWVGSEFSVTLPVSTGKIRVMYGAVGISINNGSGTSVSAGVSLGVDGLWPLEAGARAASIFLAGDGWMSMPVTRFNHYLVPANTDVTVRARCFVWGNAPGADAQFSAPRMSVEVINPN